MWNRGVQLIDYEAGEFNIQSANSITTTRLMNVINTDSSGFFMVKPHNTTASPFKI